MRSYLLIALALTACSVPAEKVDGDAGAPIDAAVDSDAGPAPDTTITAEPPADDNSTSVTFAFRSSVPGSTFACSLDGADFLSCESPATYASLGDGTHTFEVRAIGPAGATDATPASWTWHIDTSKPDTVIESGPSGPVMSPTAAFTFDSPNAGPGASFVCALDGASFSPCTSGVSYAALSEAPHGFAVRVTNAAGVTDPTPATASWTVDFTPPETTISGAPTGTVSSSSATITLASNEAPVTFACSLDGGSWSACSSPHPLAALADGMHTFQARATDAAGNTDPSPATATWTVDTTPPDTTMSSTPPDYTSSTSATFVFSSELGATFQCALDGATWATCASPLTVTVAEGTHTMLVRAVDLAGNADPTPGTRTWTVDLTAPTTTIASAPPALGQSTTAAFMFTSNEPGTFQCSLDAAAYATCPATDTISSLGQGTHRISVRAVDRAGNVDATPATWNWTVDSVPPDTTITSGPPTPNRVGMTTFTFSASEGGVSYQCSLDNAAFTACTSPFTQWIDDGTHTFAVRATDGAGNQDATPAKSTWTAQLANLVFVDFAAANNTNLGGLAGADNACALTAAQYGLQGTYKAWLSTSAVDAVDRLGGARGWVRLDGKPFADRPADIAAGKVFYPVALAPYGPIAGYDGIATGTNPQGRYDGGGSCGDWTIGNDSSSVAGAGRALQGGAGWTTHDVVDCGPNQSVQLYCFGVDRTTPIATAPPPDARRAFVSVGTWAPSGGLASADTLCATEATAAGLPGVYKALLGTSTAGALARFSSTGGPWVRPDGAAITATAASLFDPKLAAIDTPVVQTAAGDYVDAPGEVYWSTPLTSPAPASCSDWSTAADAVNGAYGAPGMTATDEAFAEATIPCAFSLQLLCFQQ